MKKYYCATTLAAPIEKPKHTWKRTRSKVTQVFFGAHFILLSLLAYHHHRRLAVLELRGEPIFLYMYNINK